MTEIKGASCRHYSRGASYLPSPTPGLQSQQARLSDAASLRETS